MGTQTGFPGGSGVKNLPAKCRRHRRRGFSPGSGRSPGVGKSNPLHYSCLENSMDREAWWATVEGLQSQTRLSVHRHWSTNRRKTVSRHREKTVYKPRLCQKLGGQMEDGADFCSPFSKGARDTWILDFWPPELWEDTFLSFKPCSLWYFVTGQPWQMNI